MYKLKREKRKKKFFINVTNLRVKFFFSLLKIIKSLENKT